MRPWASKNWIYNLKSMDMSRLVWFGFNNILCSMPQQTLRIEGGSPAKTNTRRRGGPEAAQGALLGVAAKSAIEHSAR